MAKEFGSKKLLIGMNSFNDLHFLEKAAPAVEKVRKMFGDLGADDCVKVVVTDTAWNDEVQEFFTKKYPEFEYVRRGESVDEGNVGYGKSFSLILKDNPGFDYFLVVTSDVLLNPDIVKDFVKRMDESSGSSDEIAMCAGKLRYWDIGAEGEEQKTTKIDSYGIVAEKRHHFYDLGCGEEDEGQYDELFEGIGERKIFGISGAVFLIRPSVVEELGHGDLFDENMWMYKEDGDLAYRLRWLGKQVKIFPEVWAWHARTVANKLGRDMGELMRADKGKRDYGRMHSYKNHLLLLKNNFTWRYGFGVCARTIFYELAKAAFMLLRHPLVFFAGMKTLLFTRGRRSVRRVSVKEMLKYFK